MRQMNQSSTRMRARSAFYALCAATIAFSATAQASSTQARTATRPTTKLRTMQSAAMQLRPIKRVLPNGLTVLVLENHAAPVVAVRMYVRTGSIYEGKYLGAGISHLFEHNLSEGTTTRNKQQINQDVQGIGGYSNAYTSYDVTAYHITTASSFFGKALSSLSDMMQHATFPEVEVKTQQGVIHNEMNLDEDDPDRVLNDLFYATAFRVHPVRFPIIGFRPNFDRLTQADIVGYYKSHYTPENTIVAVAGDIDADQVMAQVQAKMGAWPRRAASTPKLPNEPRQTAPRRMVAYKDVSQTYLQMGWHTIPLLHPDLYALDTLAQILGVGDSSRLVRDLREKQGLVSSIGAFSSTPNYNGGIFAVRAQMQPNAQSKVEAAIWNEIARIKSQGVSPQELHRAQRQIETAFVFGKSDVEDQAEQMAYDQMGTGNPEYSTQYVAKIKAVTGAQVQAMARKYLSRNGVTIAAVQPQSMRLGGAQPIVKSSTRLPVVTTRTSAMTARTTQTAKSRTAAARAAIKPAQMFTLPNGVRLIVRENHSTPTVAIVATALGGVRLEPSNQAGISALMAQMLTRGTNRYNTEQLAAKIDDLGASLDGFSGYNSWGIKSQWLSRDWKTGLGLFSETLLHPTFPSSELTRARAQTLARIAQQNDDPMSLASLELRKTVYGTHPYGRSTLGTAVTLAPLTRVDVSRFYQSVLQPRSLVISVYGDVNTDAVRRAIEYSFGSLKARAKAPVAPSAEVPLSELKTSTVTKPGIAQVVQYYGFPSVDVQSPDRYAIDVLDGAMSGANLPGGRLHARLRDNQLVYVVHAFDQPGLDKGMFVIYAATTKPNSARVQSIIREEVGKVVASGIAPDEMARAKTMMIASNAIENQNNLTQAQVAGSSELYGLGFRDNEQYEAHINRVTRADVQRVAQKYLGDKNYSAEAIVEPK